MLEENLHTRLKYWTFTYAQISAIKKVVRSPETTMNRYVLKKVSATAHT